MSSLSRSPLPSTSTPSLKRKTMSITQTYYLAHTARGKLSYEAGQADHNLRLLVGHANLLDSLMLELAEAEREQEKWFNQSIKKSTRSQESRHIQWADAVVEEPEEEDWEAEEVDSDSSSEFDSEEEEEEDVDSNGLVSLHRVPSQHTILPAQSTELEEDYEEEEEEEFEGLQLRLTHSRVAQQPPELDHDSDSSEDESMPPSPPSTVLETFAAKQEYSKSQTHEDVASIPPQERETFLEEGFYLPQRNPGLITAISVY